jgi:hypothetical protein
VTNEFNGGRFRLPPSSIRKKVIAVAIWRRLRPARGEIPRRRISADARLTGS